MNKYLRPVLFFALFLCLQLFVLDRLHLAPFLYPCPCILFLLTFPNGTRSLSLLLWGFALGFALDLLGNGVMGVHCTAALLTALARNRALRLLLSPDEARSPLAYPLPGYLPAAKTVVLTLVLVALQMLALSLLEYPGTFRWAPFALRSLCSTALNTGLVLLLSYTFFAKRR